MYRLFLILLISCCSKPQAQSLEHIRKSSYQTFVYKINAAAAENAILKDHLDISQFQSATPFCIFNSEAWHTDSLPNGQYVYLTVKDSMIDAELVNRSDLIIYTINNQHRVQLEVRNREGVFITDAKVFLGKTVCPYNPSAGNYLVKAKRPEEKLIKVYTPGDTCFIYLTEKEDNYRPLPSISKQKRDQFKATKMGKALNWLPHQISQLFKKQNKYSHHYKVKPVYHGLMIFNQPKYRLNDTVRLKAYLFDPHKRIYKKPAEIYLSYYKPGKGSVTQFLTALQPTDNGSLIYDFVLRDTLVNDLYYTVQIRNKAQDNLLQQNFRIEDYVLDEVTNYNLRSSKTEYFKGDSLFFFANAKDANGLNLLDASVKMILTTQRIDQFYKDTLQVPDTLYTLEKKLETQGDTKFSLSTLHLPEANILINASISFRNSNNEVHEKDLDFSYFYHKQGIECRQEDDTLYADVLLNGKTVQREGTILYKGAFEKKETISYPYRVKIDPFVEQYIFYQTTSGSHTDSAVFEMKDRYQVSCTHLSKNDTIGFLLSNPYRIPVNYSVFRNNRLIATGKGSDVQIEWKKQITDKNQLYTVKWQYIWKGEELSYSENLALLYKLLDIQVKGSTSVFPGQKDSLELTVTDYKKNPADAVNLTAFSYNSQFKEGHTIPDPPYLQTYKSKPQLLYKKYEQEDAYFKGHYSLGKFNAFRQQFGLDTMLYYQLLFPANGLKDAASRITAYMPQVSIHVVDNGAPRQLFMLYLNNRLVYYSGTDIKGPYAFEVMPGYMKIRIRLQDKIVEMDSIYVQPFYKHDIVLDLHQLPAKASITDAPDYLADPEKSQLDNSLFQMDGNNYQSYQTAGSYLWQHKNIAFFRGYNNQTAGPFIAGDSIHFFAPGRFDIHFIFEPGYRYRLSDKILRLEKNTLFPGEEKYWLKPVTHVTLALGDTLSDPPVISYYRKGVIPRFLKTDDYWNTQENKQKPCGNLQLAYDRDTAFSYMILMPLNATAVKMVKYYSQRQDPIPAGKYRVLLVMTDFSVVDIDSLTILPNTTCCLRIHPFHFIKNQPAIDSIISSCEDKPIIKNKEPVITYPEKKETLVDNYPIGNAFIRGKVVDAKGQLPIAYASVMIKGTKGGASTQADGSYLIKNIRRGRYTLLITAIGYAPKEITVQVPENGTEVVNVLLNVSEQFLQEEVVIGYGTQMKKNLTGSVVTVNQKQIQYFDAMSQPLIGRVAGVSIGYGIPGAKENIMIRGSNSITGANPPIYVVDGILYNELPKNISPDMIESMDVLKDAAATSLYGEKGANGVIIVHTKSTQLRNQFRDYAYWKPELITDKDGKVRFSVTYPDNVTSWLSYFVAMDRSLRIGKTSLLVQAYKPVMAELSVPQFLLEGDSVNLVGKSMNYTHDAYTTDTKFAVNGHTLQTGHQLLAPASSVITYLPFTSTGRDTVKAAFSLQTTTGFKDAEERKIPVFLKGVNESEGSFTVLDKDTSLTFQLKEGGTSVHLQADTKTLDVLLKELEHLKSYPYFCMEQTASKLTGLMMEKQIQEQLHQPFKEEKMMQQLLSKLQKAQLFEGGWAWWENGKPNFYITNYILHALLPFRKDPVVETNIRNGILYLQDQLNNLGNRHILLTALQTLVACGHTMDYTPYLKKINFDSLSQHEQWQWVWIQQQLKGDYQARLKKLVDQHHASMTGGIYWGTENYLWYSNTIATTVLAYKVVKTEKEYQSLSTGIIQYFLEMRQPGYWRNTLESATIVSAILPEILLSNQSFNKPAVLAVSGDTAFTATAFPYAASMSNRIRNLTVHKSGGGFTYLAVYQNHFNPAPDSVTGYFSISTYFKKNNSMQQTIAAGEKLTMEVDIHVKKDAEFVMIEIPIPAGCTYVNRNQDLWSMHKEYFKEKVVMFAEKLLTGKYTYQIELEPRYKGRYTLNPCKAELMYFPVLYGRNTLKTVDIN